MNEWHKLTVEVFIDLNQLAAILEYCRVERCRDRSIREENSQSYGDKLQWLHSQFECILYLFGNFKLNSAAELAADAFSASGRAVLIGEKTAGEMLSQTFFDLPDGLQLSLPVGDYYAFHSGWIEGKGVQPHIATNASDAMIAAKKLIGQ